MRPAFTCHSPETGTDYAIYVAVPPERGPWAAVLFMDGDDQFSFARAAYRQARAAGEVPPLLLAGVGYGASYSKPENKRGRDYTPTAHAFEPTSGGADKFLQFLRRTLWPELARRYPLRAGGRGIAGHSLGALLALHALWREPRFFTHYLASAPAIWWDERSILRIAARRRARNPRLRAKLFLGAGDRDSDSMLDDLALLEWRLAEKPFHGLHVASARFAGRTHYDVLTGAFRAGLAALFGPAAKGGVTSRARRP